MHHTIFEKAGYLLVLLLLVAGWCVTFFILLNFFLYLASLIRFFLDLARLG